jgi:hypothetical protein
MEHLAVSLKPRQGLMAGKRLASLLARTPGHQHPLAAFQSALDQMPWHLYEVRRAVLTAAGGAGKTGRAARWLHTHATGTHAQTTATLTQRRARLSPACRETRPSTWQRSLRWTCTGNWIRVNW